MQNFAYLLIYIKSKKQELASQRHLLHILYFKKIEETQYR